MVKTLLPVNIRADYLIPLADSGAPKCRMALTEIDKNRSSKPEIKLLRNIQKVIRK